MFKCNIAAECDPAGSIRQAYYGTFRGGNEAQSHRNSCASAGWDEMGQSPPSCHRPDYVTGKEQVFKCFNKYLFESDAFEIGWPFPIWSRQKDGLEGFDTFFSVLCHLEDFIFHKNILCLKLV